MPRETLGIVLAIVIGVMGFALWLADKNGKSTPALTVVVLLLICGLCLIGVYLIPWVQNTQNRSEKLWRMFFVTAIVLLAVGRYGIWVWPRTEQAEAEIKFAPAGFVSFAGQVINDWAPMLQENQTQEPLYDVQLWVSQSVLQSASDPGPWTSEWQKQIDIGTARALLTNGLDDRFYVGKHDYVRFDIFMLTRFISYREIIVMAKENENQYKAELSFYKGGEGEQMYKRTMAVGIATNPSLPTPSPSASQPLKQRTLLLANRLQMFYEERKAAYLNEGIKAYPDTPSDKQQRDTFDQKTVTQFNVEFSRDVKNIAAELEAKGLDVGNSLRGFNGINTTLDPDFTKRIGPATVALAISEQLRNLAGQIDNDGNLIR